MRNNLVANKVSAPIKSSPGKAEMRAHKTSEPSGFERVKQQPCRPRFSEFPR